MNEKTNSELKDSELLEDNKEIEVGNANIGKFNIAIFAIITIVCIIYLFTHFTE